jgi:hypothetical protein
MLTVPDELDELGRISLGDQKAFVDAATASDQRSWLYYFPFLYGFAQGATQTLLWEVFDGAICLYYLRLREEVLYLDLFLPPYPFSGKALKHAQARLRDFNERRTTRIMWVDDAQKDVVGDWGFDFREVEAEYIYDSEPIRAASGPEFYRLRRNLSKARRIPSLEIREYRQSDVEPCLDLLRAWRRHLQNDRDIEVSGFTYMRSCVEDALSFADGIIKGEVIAINDRICAFSFGGGITPAYGSLYVAISDHGVTGLGYLQRHHLMMKLDGVRYFNDSSDVGRSGLADVKKSFNPVAMNRLYRAVS